MDCKSCKFFLQCICDKHGEVPASYWWKGCENYKIHEDGLDVLKRIMPVEESPEKIMLKAMEKSMSLNGLDLDTLNDALAWLCQWPDSYDKRSLLFHFPEGVPF